MKILYFILLSFTFLQAEVILVDTNASFLKQEKIKQEKLQQELQIALEEEAKKSQMIEEYKLELQELESQISEDNSWVKSYSSYLTSLKVKNNLKKIKKRIKYLHKYAKNQSDNDELNALISKEHILASQVGMLKGENEAPFARLITPPMIAEVGKITNPFDIFTGFSLIKTLNLNFEEYSLKKENLEFFIQLLKHEIRIYKELKALEPKKEYEKTLNFKLLEQERLETALETILITLDVYHKRLELTEISINQGIEKQFYALARIATVVFVVFFIFFLLRLVVKKYITDNDRFYMANKIITFTNFTIILLIFFFNYIENAAYLVTILGFASAGIAIAMKDWFMSILGWLVIVFGGSVHVGDRIRVDMDGMKYVGDVLDISLLRITILEDITLTSIMQNRRAGRIIFIPNNYIFTRMLANYTHNSLKTVWDGIKITITFDSNHKKAMHLVKEITKKYSKGYTDITRKQLNKLRQNYSLKNTNVEPRIYSFIESNGLDIEAWYLTNAYGTLTLRSVISTEIVDAFNKEDDITIAYPTQKLNVSMQERETAQHKHEIV